MSKSDLYEYGDLCLKVHYGNWDWETARQICLNEGGDLVQPRSPGMQEYIRVNLLPQVQKSEEDGFWIGATDLNSESHWRWVSGKKFTKLMDEDFLTQKANNLSRFALKATQACLIQTGSQDRDHLNPGSSLLLEI